jgi:succinyl-diaminopimelate desuccinylase
MRSCSSKGEWRLDSSSLKAKRDYSVKLLKQLISIPSSNPHVSDRDEKEIARFLRDELKDAGFKVKLQPITSDYPELGLHGDKTFTRPNVVAKLGKKNGSRLLLNGHIDTVSGTNMKRPFDPRVSGDRLYGRGSSDMKGGVAAIVAAAQAIQESSQPLNGELVISLVVDEETLGQGTKGFLAAESGDFAIVAEPTENTLGQAQAGYLDFNISCQGESRHGQTTLPRMWTNAFLQAANICNEIMRDRSIIRSQKKMGVKMETTFNVSPVRPIVHPSLAWMTVEEFTINCLLGLVPGQTMKASEKFAKAALNRIDHHVANSNRQGARGKVTRAHWDIGFIQNENTYLRSFERAMRKVLGNNRRSYVQSFCDATHFYRANIPTILFGPGKMELGHSDKEYTSIRQVKDATSVLAYAIENILA